MSAKAKLIIVCGLPGAGKTTHAKELERSLNAIRFSADEWMDDLSVNLWDEAMRAKIEALQWKLARQLLGLGQTVVIEWGTWGRSERDALREGARAVGAAVELHYLSAPFEALLARIESRRAEDPPVTREHLQEWVRKFEEPTEEEAGLYDRVLRSAAAN